MPTVPLGIGVSQMEARNFLPCLHCLVIANDIINDILVIKDYTMGNVLLLPQLQLQQHSPRKGKGFQSNIFSHIIGDFQGHPRKNGISIFEVYTKS